MTVIANLTAAGFTKGKRYDVIDKSERFIKIVLDNGEIGVRLFKAFDIAED